MSGQAQPEIDGDSETALLRRFLEHTDVTCPACGQSLAVGIGACCWRCGVLLELSVDSSRRRTVWWAVMLLAPGMSLGLGVKVTCLILAGFADGVVGLDKILGRFWPMLTMTIVSIVGVAVLIRFRRRIWEFRRSRQIILALGLVIISGTAMAISLWWAFHFAFAW